VTHGAHTARPKPGQSRPETASSFLFVPATRPDRIPKALASGAHAVIIDLEDAVSPRDKAGARAALSAAAVSERALVRINAVGTDWCDDDLTAISSWSWVQGVVVPKAETESIVRFVRARLPAEIAVIALIESARAIEDINRIASAPVQRLFFGAVDYAEDIDAVRDDDVLAYPRSRLVTASRRNGLPPPVDTPTVVVDDLERVARDATTARRFGFGGKLCIHPSHVPIVNGAFSPSPEEVAWASRISGEAARSGQGVFMVDGVMIDAPLVARAQRILARASSGLTGSR
jgi:citrate lyase subunit beta/citryl-CoA lyase